MKMTILVISYSRKSDDIDDSDCNNCLLVKIKLRLFLVLKKRLGLRLVDVEQLVFQIVKGNIKLRLFILLRKKLRQYVVDVEFVEDDI